MSATYERDGISVLLGRLSEMMASRDRQSIQLQRLRRNVERKDERIAAMRREHRVLTDRLKLYEKQVARLERQLADCKRNRRKSTAGTGTTLDASDAGARRRSTV